MELNTEQQAAVLAPENRVLVLAGAGAGKTRTLVERVAHLIEERGASPYEIVCTTFTRAAAGEMRERLLKRIGPKANRVTVNTFHGIGLSLLKRYGSHIGLRHGHLSVYTSFETDTLLDSVAEDLGVLKRGKWSPARRTLQAMFDLYEQTGVEPDETNPGYEVFRSFYHRCRECHAMPYAGLVHGLVALAEMGKVKEYTNWKYFLIDEVQDLDAMQWRCINALMHAEGSELYCVGDISQAIYCWRGAVPEYLQSMIDTGGLSIYTLRNNYRSATAIVKAANSLIANNHSHTVLEMQPMVEGSPLSCRWLAGRDSAGLADFIVSHGFKYPPTILCRNNRMLDKLSMELEVRGVEHKRIGKRTGLLHSPLFAKFHAALKSICNHFDNTSFMLARKGFGLTVESDYRYIRLAAAQSGQSHMDTFILRQTPETLAAMPKEDTHMDTVAEWLKRGGYVTDMADGDWSTIYIWLCDWAIKHPSAAVEEYLDWLALVDVADEMPAKTEEPTMLLMTCHAAKGLEFPVVIVFGANEGIMPSKQAIRGGSLAIEDERRLMYVAATRAQKSLVLAVRPQPEDSQDEGPSRFLAEMGMAIPAEGTL